MKTLCAVFAVALLMSGSAFAAPAAAGSGKPLTAQQTLMKTCNATATEQKLKGDARKTFMKDCLAGKTSTTATTTLPAASTSPAASTDGKTAQQQLMTTCNATATTQGLKGDARKTFMKTCLSKKPDAGTTPPTSALTTTTSTPAPVGGGQYAKEADAKSHCPTDIVVWVNLDTKVYHFAGTSDYGKTKTGSYMCRKDADAVGDKAAANEKAPTH